MNKLLNINSFLNYDYSLLYNFTQIFIDIVRNSGGYNSKRLLLLPGMNADLDLTFSSKFEIPNDPANKSAISIHYYHPISFTSNIIHYYQNKYYIDWGSELDYKTIISDFNKIKNYIVDKNIPIILTEIGVITEENKDKISIMEYLYTVFFLFPLKKMV